MFQDQNEELLRKLNLAERFDVEVKKAAWKKAADLIDEGFGVGSWMHYHMAQVLRQQAEVL